MLLKEWKNWCQSKPLEALRALLLCFRSFAEVGGSFLKDFSPHQFTVGKNEVFLIDGPDALSGPLYDIFAARNLPTVYDGPVRKCSSEDKAARRRRACCCGGTSGEAAAGAGARPRRRAAAQPALVSAPRRTPSSTWRRGRAFPYVTRTSSSSPREAGAAAAPGVDGAAPGVTGRTSQRRPALDGVS